MITTLPAEDLTAYVAAQLGHFFPDREVGVGELTRYVDTALERMEANLSGQNRKYAREGGDVRFDHLHTDQYAAFLYYLSNTIHLTGGDRQLASKCYALNKALHSLDVYFEVELPEVFVLHHPVGTVLGRATYGNYLFVYQQCLVGMEIDGSSPVLGEGVVLFGGSSIIGGCKLGSNVWVSAGSLIRNRDIPENSVVSGRYPDLEIKTTQKSVLNDLFRRSAK